MHNGTPLLLAVRPVLRSDGGGPIAGTLAFGKYLGGIWQKTAAAASKIDFSLEVRDGESLPAEAGLALAAGNPLWIEPVPQNLWADGALRPTRLAAAVETELEPRRLAIVASIPPDLLAEEKRLLERQETEIRLIMVLFLIGLVAGGAAMSVPLLVMVQRGITRPVHLMEQAALVVAADPERHGSLPLVGSDELKDISRAVNVMLSELSAKRRDLMLANQALDASLLPVIVTDMARNILMVNGAFTRMYGFQPHEAIGKNPNFLNPGKETYGDTGIGENEFELLFGGLRAFYESGASQWEGMLFNRKADGSVIPCQVVISSIMASKGPIGYVGWTIDLSKRIRAEQEVRIEVYQALSDLAEQRDNETGMHIKRLGIASAELAGQIKLSPHFVEEMALFAPLHDIGKVGIQDAILLAPRKLAGDEFKVMSTHAYIGYTILAEKKTMQTAAEIAWCHHERWDGTGYPRGLAGEDIPLSARIVAVIDVYDALRSHRPYKEPWSHEQAVEYVVSAAGSHFDPDIVAIFERGNEKFRAIFDANS
jgi:PAS domain S-box-containing protein